MSIKSLYQRLDQCLIADRLAIHKKLQLLQRRLSEKKPADRLQDEVLQLLERSEAKVSKRQYTTAIKYPDLPVSGRRDEIAKAIAEHQVVVVAGETGSGKTTQLPKICLELGLGQKGMIGHTQPRRLAARTVANRIAEELETSLGSTVGYQVRFTEQVADNTMVKLMTDGILLAETQNDRYLERYEVLIIDEAHERSLNIDFLLGYLHRILPKRPDLKVIITSATIDLERFSKHFNNAPVIEVSGRTYPVDVLYRPLEELDEGRDKSIPEGIVCATEELIQLERQQGRSGAGDILVFLSGEREIREAADYLRKAVQQGRLKHIEVMPLYARLSLAEQNRIFNSRGAGRRIVLSTNVAETSLTVPGIRYVIDPGLARISRYSYRSKVQRLPIEAVSQASANQRKGRCGRVAEGICIRLYSEDDFISRPEFTDAEIRRTNLAAVILQMLNLRLGSIDQFPFIDPPDSRYINDGFKLLQELGAVDAKRNLTRLGRQLSRLPVDPKIGRMLLAAAQNNCLSEMIIIASALSVQDPRERPMEKQQAADQKHREYADEESDFVTLINLWHRYEEQRQELSQNQLRKYCQKNFLAYMRMREWRDVHRQLHLICKNLDYKENAAPASYESLHKALLSGLLGNMGFKQEGKEYLGARNRRFSIFPGSMLYKKAPKWIMAAELVETSRLFARMVARVDPLWAEPLAGHLVKRSYLEPHWEKKKAQVVAQEQVTLYGLIIVPGRTIHYGKVDPDVSQQIFIRSALVEGHFTTKGKFFSHNRELLSSIESLEAKSRRRDLLVDEDTLADFYQDKLHSLGGEQVVNGAGFESWRQKIEQQDPQALFMREEDILQRSADHVSQSSYPEQLDLSGAKLKLSYHFEPGAKDDGVTLHAPLVLLNQLSDERLQWLVPGMLKEKCVALLKGLPKSLRKNFVPIPDYVDAFVEAAVFGDGSLNEALALHLKRMTGVRITVDDLNAVALDDHYKVNVRLFADRKKVVAEGRNLTQLQRQHGQKAQQALTAVPSESWGRKGITVWDFDDLPEAITLKQAGGLEVEVYPGIQDNGDSIELRVFESREKACKVTRNGLARLFLLQLSEQMRYLRNKLPGFQQTAMQLGKVQSKKSLEDDLLLSGAVSTFINGIDAASGIHSKAEFEQRLQSGRAEYCDQVIKEAGLLAEVARRYHNITKQLSGKVDLQSITILNDIKAQLNALICPGFLTQLSAGQLQDVIRYLKGIELRLEKYPRELPRQRMLSEQLQQFWQQYSDKKDLMEKHQQYSEALESYRWLLEEYRVSLFAQQLGTRVTVSEKRLKQQWNTIT